MAGTPQGHGGGDAMNNSSAAAALLHAGLRRGDSLVCCGRCGHSRDDGGTVLVRLAAAKRGAACA